MSRHPIVGAAAVVLAVAALVGCSERPSLSSLLEEQIESGDGWLDLGNVVEPSVDHFLIVCPYESADSVRERIGFDWARAPDLSESDPFQVVVLVARGEVRAVDRMQRSPIDFCGGSEAWPLLGIDARLPLRAGDGGLWEVVRGDGLHIGT